MSTPKKSRWTPPPLPRNKRKKGGMDIRSKSLLRSVEGRKEMPALWGEKTKKQQTLCGWGGGERKSEHRLNQMTVPGRGPATAGKEGTREGKKGKLLCRRWQRRKAAAAHRREQVISEEKKEKRSAASWHLSEGGEEKKKARVVCRVKPKRERKKKRRGESRFVKRKEKEKKRQAPGPPRPVKRRGVRRRFPSFYIKKGGGKEGGPGCQVIQKREKDYESHGVGPAAC